MRFFFKCSIYIIAIFFQGNVFIFKYRPGTLKLTCSTGEVKRIYALAGLAGHLSKSVYQYVLIQVFNVQCLILFTQKF